MPITRGAKKAIRSADRKRVFNVRRKRAVKDVVKEIEDLVKSKKLDEAKVLLPKAYKALDKAVKMGTIKKNAASRKKSRLSKMVKK